MGSRLGSHSAGESGAASSSKAPPGAPDPDPEEGDLTQLFGLEATEKVELEAGQSVKEQFLASELVVPGIALKKFWQIQTTEHDGNKYLGILAKDECKMYRVAKPRLCALAMGDVLSEPEKFWQLAVQQCKNQKVGGVFIFDSFEGDLAQARLQ